MSLNRALLRIYTVAALTRQPTDAADITIAGDAVFDSRLDNIEFEKDSVELPIIAVYTDEDSAQLRDTGSGGVGGSYLRTLILRIDIAIGSFQKTVTPAGATISYSLPTTDSELEMMLDLFEAQVWRALMMPGRTISDIWSSLIVRLDGWQSRPHRDQDGNNRLAARSITLHCTVNQDCLPTVGLLPRPQESHVTPTLDYAPWLNPMLATLADNPAQASLLDVFRDRAGVPSVYLPQLKTINVDYRVCVDSTQFPNFTRAKTPRRKYDPQTSWSIP